MFAQTEKKLEGTLKVIEMIGVNYSRSYAKLAVDIIILSLCSPFTMCTAHT